MKKVTLVILVTFAFMLFSGQTRIDSLASTNIIKAEANTFSTTHTFSTATALETYIQISPPSVQLYYFTKKYCNEYDVPESVAFGILKLETTYRGPNTLDYSPNQTSRANAYGSYQLLLSTARDMYVLLGLGTREELTPDMLLNNVQLNAQLGIRYLRYLNDNISTDWKVACGYYNTGYKRINKYALDATKYM